MLLCWGMAMQKEYMTGTMKKYYPETMKMMEAFTKGYQV